MSKFLILHGKDGSPNANWFMWLKGILIGQGNKVWLPLLPNASTPNVKANNDLLLGNPTFTYGDDTIIVGHSAGAVQALHLLQNLPEKVVIKGVVLVSAFKDDLGWEGLRGLFVEPLDFEAIKAHCKKFVFIHSDDDPYCPVEHAEYLALKTGGELLVFEGQGHFSAELDPHYKQFPELLDVIQELEES